MTSNPEVKEQMFAHIEQWKKSDLSQKKYCSQHNIRYHVFHYWFKRFREALPVIDKMSSFVKLQVEQPATAANAELIFPDGKRLVFHEPVSSSFIKALIG
jgi:hypothetical protein